MDLCTSLYIKYNLYYITHGTKQHICKNTKPQWQKHFQKNIKHNNSLNKYLLDAFYLTEILGAFWYASEPTVELEK